MSTRPRQNERARPLPWLPVLLMGLVALSGSLVGAPESCADRAAGRATEGTPSVVTAPTATAPTAPTANAPAPQPPSAIAVLQAATPTPQCGPGTASGGTLSATVRPVRALNEVLRPRDASGQPGSARPQAVLHARRALPAPARPSCGRPADVPSAPASMGPRRSVVLRV